MKPNWRVILRWVGYPIFYAVALVVFAYLTFPYERLRDRLVTEFNSREKGPTPKRLEIDELDGWWLSGLEANGVRLAALEQASDDKHVAKPIEITQAHVSVSLLRLLVGTMHLTFGADAFGGKVSGWTSDADQARALNADFAGVDMGSTPFLPDAVGLPLGGTLDGNVDLLAEGGKLSDAKGKVSFVIEGLTIGDGKAKIRDTIALPKLEAGKLEFTAELGSRFAKIEKLSASGPDLELVADGKVRLREPLETSLAELSLRFRFTDRYKQKSDTTRSIFGSPGGPPGIFELDPKNRRAKRADGFYGWRVTGPFNHLTFEPSPIGTTSSDAPPGATAPGTRATRPPRGGARTPGSR